MATTHILAKTILTLIIGMACHSVNAIPFQGFGAEMDSYIKEASTRYQVDEPMLRGLIKMENGWRGDISPTGATGVGQFTVTTWNWLASSYEGQVIGMKYITSKNRGRYNDPRKNRRVNTLATALLARWHVGELAKRGIKVSDENLYMAHNIGLDGLHRAIIGKATAADIRNMRLNGKTKTMSVSGFLTYQKRRFAQHKREANSIVTAKNATANTVNTPVTTKTSMITTNKPKNSQRNVVQNTHKTTSQNQKYLTENPNLIWILPSDNLVWINPQ